jgi:heptosyltransferase-2
MSVSFKIPPRRILVRGTNWLGDAVMTTPALLRLREKFPDAHITLLTPEKLADLWLNHPAIDDVISFTREEGPLSVASRLRAEALKPFMESHRERIEAGRTAYEETAIRGGTLAQAAVNVVKQVSQKTIDVAQQGRIDLALVLPNSPRSALEVFLADIPQRIGYARPWRNIFLTQTVAPRTEVVKMRKRSVGEIHNLIRAPKPQTLPPPSSHQIYEFLHLTATLGANPEPLAPQLFVTAEEIESAKKKFGLEKSDGPIFGLNPGAEYGPAKRWPVEKFSAAAKEIQQQTNCTWILFGGKDDTAITNQIESAIGNRQLASAQPGSAIFNLAGKTSLRELMALLKPCCVLLTNDTGPMHVAAALGTPVIVPFGSTSPELTGPGLPGDPRHRLLKSDAPCSPCFLRECPIDFRCMNGISVERVVEAVQSLAASH